MHSNLFGAEPREFSNTFKQCKSCDHVRDLYRQLYNSRNIHSFAYENRSKIDSRAEKWKIEI